MRRIVGVVMDGNLRGAAARNMADSDQFEIILGDFIVSALDLDSDALSGFQQDAVRADFDIEFINLIGFERRSLVVSVDRLPRRGCGGGEFSLRTPAAAPRQKSAPAPPIGKPQGSEPQEFPACGGTR